MMDHSPTTKAARALVAALLTLTSGVALAVDWEPKLLGTPPAVSTQAPSTTTGPKQKQPVALLKAPLFNEAYATFPVATIDDEVVTLRDLGDLLAASHLDHQGSTAAKQDFTVALDRALNVRALALEARDMGMLELPEAKELIAEFREQTLRAMVERRATKDVKVDPAALEKANKNAVQEWKIRSVLFAKEDDAKAAAASLAGGKSFDEVAKQAVADKKATGGEQPDFVAPAKLLPEIAAIVSQLQLGQVSAPIKLKEGHTILRLEDVRYPENPMTRARLENQFLEAGRAVALRDHFQALVKKYVKIDQKLLDRLDFHAKKPGIASLAKDKRVVARIQGEKPITVADLTEAVSAKFFHGVAGGVRDKSLNKRKHGTLDSMLVKRVGMKEAARQRIEESAEFKDRMHEQETALAFEGYLQKVLLPEVKLTEEDLEKYYEEHKTQFTYPALYKLDSVGFASAKDAQSALDKLKSGMEFRWMKTNADGQLAPSKRSLRLEGTTVTSKSLPEGLVGQLSGAKEGDYRLYSASRDEVYVVQILEYTPARTESLQDVKADIQKSVFMEKVNLSIGESAKKMREAREVKVFITGIEM